MCSLYFVNREFYGRLSSHLMLLTKGCIYDFTIFKPDRRNSCIKSLSMFYDLTNAGSAPGNLSVSFKVPIIIANFIPQICLHFLCLFELSLHEYHSKTLGSYLTVTEYKGKVHGSQRDRDPKTGLLDLLVYYEVPLGQREQAKRKFNDFVLSIITRTN